LIEVPAPDDWLVLATLLLDAAHMMLQDCGELGSEALAVGCLPQSRPRLSGTPPGQHGTGRQN
jgi:hypothetical protein